MTQPQLFFDGWYSRRFDAMRLAEHVKDSGAHVLGVVASPHRTFGVFYVHDAVLFANHTMSEWMPEWFSEWVDANERKASK